MNPKQFHKQRSVTEYGAVIDTAKRRSVELRQEAIRDFWLALGTATLSAWRAVRGDVAGPGQHHPPDAGRAHAELPPLTSAQ